MRHVNLLLWTVTAVAVVPVTATAQDDGGWTSTGWSIGGDALATVMRTRPIGAAKETPTGVGLRGIVSYGFTDDWSLFGALQTVSIRTGSAESLRQGEVGGRLTLLDDGFAARPYFEAAVAMRQITIRLPRVGETVESISSTGSAAVLAGGVQLFVSPRFAIDVALAVATGSFRDPRIDGERAPVLEGSVPSTTLRIGVKRYLAGSSN